MKKLRNLLISILILIVFFKAFDYYLSYNISKEYKKTIGKLYGSKVKNTGNAILNIELQNDNLILLGSSELGVNIHQNPSNFFPIKDLKSTPSLIGRAYVQSLEHSLNLGANHGSLKDKKVVFVVSLQWFQSKEISKDGFNANFSELKFYEYIHNKDISSKNKVYIANRVGSLLQGKGEYKYAKLYSKLYASDKLTHKIVRNILEPYYFSRTKILSYKDKFHSYQLLKNYKKSGEKEANSVHWQNEYIIAEKEAKSQCTNNKFFVNDKYYNKYLRNKIDSLKGSMQNVVLNGAKEYEDYKLFLETCKELNINPLIVIMPVNGYYYDYTGLDKNKRLNFYKTIESMANEYGFKALNLSEKEYEPYYMIDVMHLGWKGWLNIDEEITKHFNK